MVQDVENVVGSVMTIEFTSAAFTFAATTIRKSMLAWSAPMYPTEVNGKAASNRPTRTCALLTHKLTDFSPGEPK